MLAARIRKYGPDEVEHALRAVLDTRVRKADWIRRNQVGLSVILRHARMTELAGAYRACNQRRPPREIRPIDENNGLTEEEIDRQMAEIERLIEAGVPA
jgi:hypothetical protein